MGEATSGMLGPSPVSGKIEGFPRIEMPERRPYDELKGLPPAAPRHAPELLHRIHLAGQFAALADAHATQNPAYAIMFRDDGEVFRHRGSELIWAAGVNFALGAVDRAVLYTHRAVNHDAYANGVPQSDQPAFRTAVLNAEANGLGILVVRYRAYIQDRCAVRLDQFSAAISNLMQEGGATVAFALVHAVTRGAEVADLLEEDDVAGFNPNQDYRPVLAGQILADAAVQIQTAARVLAPPETKVENATVVKSFGAEMCEMVAHAGQQNRKNPEANGQELATLFAKPTQPGWDAYLAYLAYLVRNHYSHGSSPIPGLNLHFSSMLGRILRTVIQVHLDPDARTLTPARQPPTAPRRAARRDRA